jgi:autotransporter translocation and assembly factor TamB
MLQRLARVLVVLLAIVTLALVAVWVVTNTEFGRERVRRFALKSLAGSTHGIVRMGGIRGNLLSGATITGVSITDSAGRPFLKADSLSARYSIGSFVSGRLGGFYETMTPSTFWTLHAAVVGGGGVLILLYGALFRRLLFGAP